MASSIYPKYMESLIQGSANTSLAGTVKAALVDTGTYTYNAAHDFLDDLTGVVGTAETLGTKTYTDGVFDAADIAAYNAAGGASAEAIVIYIDTGVAGTSRLVAYIDTFTATPSGVTTVTITWATGEIINFLA